ncbi:MAG: hypothetical protein J0L87_09490 [Bacteroidetes bacterium]|nr:hypothetical protein [Bacteroidota bacterium]
MKNLLLSSFIVLFLYGCSLGHYEKLKSTLKPESVALHSLFGENFNSFLFKTNIRVYGKDFSGLLVTKQMQPNDYRVIFTTELGMKLFDFEFKDTSFTLHYCVPQFNRPALLKTIQKDIEILLMNETKNKTAEVFINPKDSAFVYKFKDSKLDNYYFLDKLSRQIYRIEHAKKNTKKITFDLNNYSDQFPSNIMIKHHDIKLKIELNLLKK